MDKYNVKKFLETMKECKDAEHYEKLHSKFMDAYEYLQMEVKNYFPMNKIPKNIIDSLEVLKNNIMALEGQLHLSIDTIIEEIEQFNKSQD